MTNARPEAKKGKRKLHLTADKKLVTAKKAMTNGTKSEFTSHCRIAAKMNFLLLFPARFACARYSSRMIGRFLNWGDHGKPKSGKIKGRCQPPPPPVISCLAFLQVFLPFLLAGSFLLVAAV